MPNIIKYYITELIYKEKAEYIPVDRDLFGFFYCLKIHRCRSPPHSIWNKQIEWGKKMRQRPKRRKKKDNPYTLDYCEDKNVYIISFKDGKGIWRIALQKSHGKTSFVRG